jgi:hypothetical protein
VKDFLQGTLKALLQRIDCLAELLDGVREFPPVKEKCIGVKTLLSQGRAETDKALDLLSGPADILENIAAQYRALAHQVYLIEQVFVSPVSRFSVEDERLSKLSERICKEIGILNDIPVIVAASNQYFCTIPAFGVIYIPVSESRSLLNLPDLYHEISHHLHRRGYPILGHRFTTAWREYVEEAVDDITRLSRPVDVPRFRNLMAFWRYWGEEVAADAFATIILGPAYGWANLHLMLRSLSIFDYSPTHPADAARMDHILRILRSDPQSVDKLGLLEDQWKRYLGFPHPAKPDLYDLLHGAPLFTAVLDDVRDAINTHGLKIPRSADNSIAHLLNEAWERLPAKPSEYATWENEIINQIFS